MSVGNFLQLIRWKNLLMIALIQSLFRYIYFPTFSIATALDNLHFGLLIFATLCIAAAGNIINDIYDIKADKINKPTKVLVIHSGATKLANHFYIILNLIGISVSLYLSIHIGYASFVATFIATALLLKVYSTFLKKKPIIGNMVVSLLISLSILIVGFFDIIPAITEENGVQQYFGFGGLLDYAVFAFMFNFLREIVKDIEDIDGDINLNMNTLPILIGRKRSRNVIFTLSFIPLFLVTFYSFSNFSKLPFVLAYMLIVVMLPFLYFMSKLLYAEKKQDYIFLSRLLKLIMLLGMLSIIIISISITYAE
ncbi:MAG: geranylgeranylglycerol-phosphate geranylgeranyltransferase [Flavobacteriaceae bacterium]|nr:geranylgeranylglycerol-phosphate geranylgeranyltransferase [Flavobacteriaceae bacterium]